MENNLKKYSSWMILREENLKGNLGIFLYRIFNDIFVILMVSLALLLVSESVMPGLVSAYMSFTRLILIIFAVLGAILYIGKINAIEFELGNKPRTFLRNSTDYEKTSPLKVRGKKTVFIYGLMIFSVLLIVNSLLKFAWWEIAAITVASIFLLFYLYKNFLK